MGDSVKVAGFWLDGFDKFVGFLFIVDMVDCVELDVWLVNDFYVFVGLFESVEVVLFCWVINLLDGVLL